MDVVLIRHARPQVEAGICYGALDLPLCEPLFPTPEALLRALHDAGASTPRCIVASPATRARATAERLAAACGLAVVETDARLREVDFGAWEGLRWDDLPREGLDQWATDLLGACPHGGECTGDALARVVRWADDIPERYGDDATLWVVCHAGPMRMLAAHWLGLPLSATLNWQLGWGASCGFRLQEATDAADTARAGARLLWWNRVPVHA